MLWRYSITYMSAIETYVIGIAETQLYLADHNPIRNDVVEFAGDPTTLRIGFRDCPQLESDSHVVEA